MENHYETLGLKNSATQEEIRRAYRVLARRYHPDVNPGRASEDRFKKIASAYTVLSDPKKKQAFDVEFERELRHGGGAKGFQAYADAQQREYRARQRHQQAQQRRGAQQRGGARPAPTQQRRDAQPFTPSLKGAWNGLVSKIKEVLPSPSFEKTPHGAAPAGDASVLVPRRVSVIEVSLSIREAVYGVKRTVEVSEPEGARKISVTIPPGVRTGSVVRMKGKSSAEELILIIRVATHPFLSIQARGLVAEIPISVSEAISGASITVPTLDEAMIIKVPAGSQSGTEIRIPDKGLPSRDGSRGELFVKLMIYIPSSNAVGIRDVAAAFDQYYEAPVRTSLPKNLLNS